MKSQLAHFTSCPPPFLSEELFTFQSFTVSCSLCFLFCHPYRLRLWMFSHDPTFGKMRAVTLLIFPSFPSSASRICQPLQLKVHLYHLRWIHELCFAILSLGVPLKAKQSIGCLGCSLCMCPLPTPLCFLKECVPGIKWVWILFPFHQLHIYRIRFLQHLSHVFHSHNSPSPS